MPDARRAKTSSRWSSGSAMERGHVAPVRTRPRRAVFVGAKAYQEAGGVIIRDLFDTEGGGFFADAGLLNRVAREKLQRHADKVTAEGWRWVVAEPELDHEAVADMRRVFPKPMPLSGSERKKLRKLEARIKALYDKYPDGEMSADDAGKFERIEAAINALRREEPANLQLRDCYLTHSK